MSGLSFLEVSPEQSKTMIFLHGNSHSKNSFQNQLSSQELSSYRMIAIDLLGHGESAKNKDYSLPLLANEVDKLLTQLKVEDCILVGHSLGGHVATHLLKLRSIKAIMIFGTPTLTKPFIPAGFKANQKAQALSLVEVNDTELQILGEELGYLGEELNTFKNDFRATDKNFRAKIFESVFSGNYEDELELLNKFEGRILAINSINDTLIASEYVEAVMAKVQGECLTIESGHSPQITDAQNFNNILLSFTQSLFGESGHFYSSSKENSQEEVQCKI